MAYKLAIKDGLDTMEVKTKMVNNINKLSQDRALFLVENMAILIDKSTQQGEKIDDKNTQRDFITFLISLYY